MKRISFGFDLRVKAKPREQASKMFLTPAMLGPISADPLVWPRPSGIDSIIQDRDLPLWNPFGLARSIEPLVNACREREIPTVNTSPICLTVSSELRVIWDDKFGPGYFEDMPDEGLLNSRGWKLLGFDVVALDGLHSALKGIGYKEPLWSELMAQFGNDLNDAGLFRETSRASKFTEIGGNEIPSHAPFRVVGVLVHDPIS